VRKITKYLNVQQEIRENFNHELIGLVCSVVGMGLLFSLWRDPSMVPWLVKVAGWTAPWFALTLTIAGIVFMLNERAGYWSLEALVGAELLLFSLQANSFAINHKYVDWSMPLDGREGGQIGWALGSLFVAALGQSVAVSLLGLLTILGSVLLLCYTPLRYLLQILVHIFPDWHATWNKLIEFWCQWWSSILPQPIVDEGLETWEVSDEAAIFDDSVNRIEHSKSIQTESSPKVQHKVNTTIVDKSDINASPRYKTGRNPSSKRSPDEQISGKPDLTPAEPVVKQQKKSQVSKDPKRQTRPRPLRKAANLPSLDLLTPDSGSYGSIDVDWMSMMIEETLEDFNVPVKVIHVESGPTVTQFGVEPQFIERAGKKRKIRVNSIVNLADDLALALAAPSAMVSMHGIIASKAMKKSEGHLTLPLGRDTTGEPVLLDLARAPHLLIAGATGAGKSVCINTIITGLLMKHGPESLKFVMVDPKTVELPGYNGIPHLLGRVITDMDQVMGALTWLLLEMDDRYQLFRELGVRNLEDYNNIVRKEKKKDKSHKPLPYIVLIIDELADLMMTSAEDIESQLCRLAQKARATGIHLIIATQRPSTDVVTGLIKANFPTRIAFAVTSQIDSRVILDSPGAERLLGRGDMLLMRSDAAKLFRIQGCFVQDEEIEEIVRYWVADGKVKADGVTKPTIAPWNSMLDRMDDQNELLQDAIDVVRGKKSCSASVLQKALGITYPQASNLIEQLEKQKVLGPEQGSGRGRKVLLKPEEIENTENIEEEKGDE